MSFTENHLCGMAMQGNELWTYWNASSLTAGPVEVIKSEMNVLLVSYSFPPCGGTGVMRASSLARFFPSEGIRVDVLTARNAAAVGADTKLLESIPREVTIHRTFTLDLPFGLKKSIKRFVTGKRRASNSDGQTGQKGTNGGFATIIADVLSPDPQVTWIPVLKRSATSIIR